MNDFQEHDQLLQFRGILHVLHFNCQIMNFNRDQHNNNQIQISQIVPYTTTILPLPPL